MGKWTLNYHDDVLRDKFKSMVDGAINRAKLEKGEPTITYEAFVADLDIGDSFASSLLDVLVKEMADRRTRTNPSDRRLISERTAKSLRLQATRLRVYRDRFTTSHNLHRLTPQDYLGLEMDRSEDDDEDGSESTQVYELGGVPEGVRLGHNFFEAVDTSYDVATPTFMPLSPPPMGAMGSAERVTSPRPMSPPLRPLRGGSGANLTRQTSIRRPPRTRTLDFNEFTSRRRHVHRSNSELAASGDMLRSEDSLDGTWRFSSAERSRLAGTPVYVAPRRFFPLAAWTDTSLRGESDLPGGSGEARGTSENPITLPHLSLSNHQYPTTGGFASTSSARSLVPPRLRRGGLRAPESLLATAPASTSSRSEALADAEGSASEAGSVTPTATTLTLRRNRPAPEFVDNEEGPHQLLTPRSISPDGENA